METARLRVESKKITTHLYRNAEGDVTGEVIQIKASGFLDCPGALPCSLHFTVPPGHNLPGFLGDNLKITIERDATAS